MSNKPIVLGHNCRLKEVPPSKSTTSRKNGVWIATIGQPIWKFK